MRKSIALVVLACLLFVLPGCKPILGPDPAASVVLIEGPIFEDGWSIFYVKGRVQNTGDAAAPFAKITIFIRDASSALLAQDWAYIDDTDLAANETSAFSVLFSDDGGTVRAAMDFSKTTWEIKWD